MNYKKRITITVDSYCGLNTKHLEALDRVILLDIELLEMQVKLSGKTKEYI